MDMCYIYPNPDPQKENMPRKLKAEMCRIEISDLPQNVDAAEEFSRILSEEFAKAIDKEIFDGLLEMTYDDNVALLEKMFPGQGPQDALLRLGLGGLDLKREYSLREKNRKAKIDLLK